MTEKSLGQIAHDIYLCEFFDISDWEHMHPYEAARWSAAAAAVADTVRKQVAAECIDICIDHEDDDLWASNRDIAKCCRAIKERFGLDAEGVKK